MLRTVLIMTDRRRGDGRVTLRTTDPHEAEAAIEEAYLPNRIDLLGDEPLELHLDAIRLKTATAGLVSFGSETRIRTAEATDFHVNLPVRGGVVNRIGSEDVPAVPGQSVVSMPDRPADILWRAGSAQLCLMIPEKVLKEELELLMGRSAAKPLIFETAMDVSNPTLSGWRASLAVLESELVERTFLTTHARVARQIERLIVDGLLLGQRHNYSEALERGASRSPAGSVEMAVRLLEDRPEEAWSTSALAARVHQSPRALQEGFARDVGIPPMTYLQQVRLRRARDFLSDASSADTTVSAVAAQLGIFHQGRFAAAYRRAFGEAPSQTLRRA
jgi:AraC-like DNA-binding protein